MIEINFVGLWFFYVGIVALFLLGLLTSQHLNSIRLFRMICVSFSICILYLPLYLKWYSPWHFTNADVLFVSAITSLLFSLKFLEWGFAYDWDKLRTVTVKQVAMDCSSFPRVSPSIEKQSSSNIKDIYRDNTIMLVKAVVQFFILRILLYVTSDAWLSLPVSSISLWTWPFRYLWLAFILYVIISIVTNIVFSISGLIWGAPMNSTFPAFPFLSCSIREFWSYRWNVFIKQILQRTSFVVIPNCLGMSQTMSKPARGLISFIVSGILHELLFTMCTDKWSGKSMIFFPLHGLFVTIEILWNRMNKTTETSRTFLAWLRTIGIFVITLPLFFDPWLESGYYITMKKNLV